MKKIVIIENGGFTYYLKKTTFAMSLERAQVFENETDAYQALQDAKKFIKPALFKKAQIIDFVEGK